MRYIHLGIDYGTSATKVVVRDYGAAGGVKAYPLRWWTGSHSDFRLPSWVATTKDGHAWFGVRPGGNGAPRDGVTWHQSLKMRVAAQRASDGDRAQVYAKALPQLGLPGGWGYRGLLAVSLAWVVCRAKEKSLEITGVPAHKTRWGVTFGLPTDFRHDRGIASRFLAIYRAAFAIAGDAQFCRSGLPAARDERRPEPVRLSADLLARVRGELDRASTQDDADADYWHQSEARASVLWAWNSPRLRGGSYLHVDVGAGTTNVVGYLVNEQPDRGAWVKTGISVFSSGSGPVGFDAVAEHAGRIPQYLKETPQLRLGFEQPYRQVFGDIRRLTHASGAPWAQWSSARIIYLGGGTHVEGIPETFRFHPYQGGVESLDLTAPPPDLELGLHRMMSESERLMAHREARHSLAIAYGLSVPGDSLPGERTPDQIPPLDPPRTTSRQTLEGIYAR